MKIVNMRPLTGITVIDFSNLLPGPLATLMLAELGANVIKVERPPSGDEMRQFGTSCGKSSALFALLNRGKRSVALNLKDPTQRGLLEQAVQEADVLLEQFRPGVMERLELDYDRLQAINPRLVYCSLTGYGQKGPKASQAGHDLNYLSEVGMLKFFSDANGTPIHPPPFLADICGGTYPVVINILAALRIRDMTGCGCHLDISISDNLFLLMLWALAEGTTTNKWPTLYDSTFTGGTARYQLYQTKDNQLLAVAALEETFWAQFCSAIDLPDYLRDDSKNPQETMRGVETIIGAFTLKEWLERFAGKDVCCTPVTDLQSAIADVHFKSRGLFGQRTVCCDSDQKRTIPAIPLPIAASLRDSVLERPAPQLGEFNQSLLEEFQRF